MVYKSNSEVLSLYHDTNTNDATAQEQYLMVHVLQHMDACKSHRQNCQMEILKEGILEINVSSS